MNSSHDTTPRQRRSAFSELLDQIGSVWFGVTIMVLILVYCWLGSAGTQPFYNWFPRQTFELTEMEWFSWWPFQVMVALLCVSLVLVTVRKIQFNLPNLGVWITHVGIVMLAVSCAVYFGLKLEGDIPVYKRQVVLQAAGGSPVQLPLQPGVGVEVHGRDVRYDVRVSELQHDYELLTAGHEGETAYSAQLTITPYENGRKGQTFVRQVLDGYPEFTEDVIPGQGRAVKAIGKPLVDERLDVRMDYHDPDQIFLHHRRALHVRRAGTLAEWTEIPLKGLPRYSEHMDSTDVAMVQPGQPPLRAKRLRLDPEPEARDADLMGYDVAVTGYLPYAVLRETWGAGGTELNPMLRFSMSSQGRRVTEELLAFDPQRNVIEVDEEFGIHFRWIEDQKELDEFFDVPSPTLTLRVPGRTEPQRVSLVEAMARPIPVEGSDLKVQAVRLYPRWSMTTDEGQAQMVLVRVTGPETNFLRAVITPRKDLSQDLVEGGHGMTGQLDPSIDIEASALPLSGLTFVAGPVGSHVLLVNQAGEVEHREAAVGETISFLDGELTVRMISLVERAREVRVPLVVPRHERNLKAGDAYSLVQVELRRGDEARREWIEYSHYTQPSRMGFSPEVLRVGDGPPLELVYSRETHPLPAPVALEEFKLETYPGGEKERDYISMVRFYENGAWSDLHEVRSNQPTEHAGWWYFQATWDPPEPRRGYAGMFYTGLGVGNRHGVLAMLFGSALTVFGTIWAFYVKPLILRRRREGRGEELDPVEAELPPEEKKKRLTVVAGGAAMTQLEEGR